ncbi:MAG: ATPase, T2SS/T4P/T4SS family [Polyangiales bacterium]
MPPVTELLALSPLFKVLSANAREQVSSRMTEMSVVHGVELLRQGERADAVFLLGSGALGLFRFHQLRAVATLSETVDPPSCVGVGAVLTASTHSETAIALEPSTVYRLPADVFNAVVGQSAPFAAALAKWQAEQLAKQAGERAVPFVSLAGRRFDPTLWSLGPDSLLRRAKILPLELAGRTLTVGMVDPYDMTALEGLARTIPGHRFRPVAISSAEFTQHLDQEAARQAPRAGASRASSAPSTPTIQYLEDDEVRVARGGATAPAAASGPQVVALVDEMIVSALNLSASDIHLEHDRRGVLIRYRVDGSLQPKGDFLPAEFGRPLVSRLKLLAKLDITETRRPQDGRISFRSGARLIDLRVSTMPSKLGEKVVMRVLDGESGIADPRQLFPFEHMRAEFMKLAFQPQGLVLVSGPTGSGKTTTLYSALTARRRPEINVITVEDPIEYHLDGVTQIQVQPEIGVTFATVLRALLRQDPNVILVGETRDAETLRIALEASMTGHLVLTSVHTNGAPEAVVRLDDLGAERYAVAAAVAGVLHQRLVRRICGACAEPFVYPSQLVDAFFRLGALTPGVSYTFQRGAGCSQCQGTGFKGRVAIFELLTMTDALRETIVHKPEVTALRATARAEGSLYDLARYAGQLVAAGLTAPGEVLHLIQRPG